MFKEIKMDISKYTDYFHDGYVNKICHTGNNLSISLESSVIENMNPIEDKNFISESNTFKVVLNIYNIKSFLLGGKKYEGVFRMEYDDGDILDFQIKKNMIFFIIEWKNFFPKIPQINVSKIEIEAEKIEWIPDLFTLDK